MADTLGSLVDKLTVVNLKLWFVQDWVHKVQENSHTFQSTSPADVEEKIRQLGILNKQRNGLMSEIDCLLEDAVRNGVVNIEERIKV